MAKLTLAVIARDEERDLPRCLDSVPCAEEKLVVDSGSTDRTRELAVERGARVVEHAWEGYGRQKAFAFAQAQGEWILNLDADEALSPELVSALPAALARGDVDGYQLRFRSELFGRTLRFGGWGGERHLRLFRKGRYRVAERSLHEGVEVQGPVGELSGYVLHRPYAGLSEYLAKLDRYTTLAAADRHARGRRFRPLTAAVRLPWGFLRRYVLQLGLLDGYAGFAAAALGAFYDFLKEAKLQDMGP